MNYCNLFGGDRSHTEAQGEESGCIVVLPGFEVVKTLKATVEEMTHTAVDEAYMYRGEYSSDYVRPDFG